MVRDFCSFKKELEMRLIKSLLAATVLLFSGLMALPASAQQFMNFPVSGVGPFTSGIISSVLDHEVPHALAAGSPPFGSPSSVGPYGYSGAVLSFTGELFVSNGTYPTANLACYPKPSNANQTSTWRAVLQGVYTGTSGSGANNCTVNNALNYDNHPGYDYIISSGTNVHPAASGNIIFTKCIKTFTNVGTCESYGAVAVDHGNGFVTQYLHMANLNYGSAASGSNQPVTTAWTMGTVSNVGVTAIHLHLEVLQRKSSPPNSTNYYARENYWVVDPYGYRTASFYADNLLSKPGCLWAVGCSY